MDLGLLAWSGCMYANIVILSAGLYSSLWLLVYGHNSSVYLLLLCSSEGKILLHSPALSLHGQPQGPQEEEEWRK